jgi:hypothetical protein
MQDIVSELDGLREEVAYLKFWQGVAVVTAISLIAWLFSSTGAATWLLLLAFIGAMVLSFTIFALHRRIERRIEQIRKL